MAENAAHISSVEHHKPTIFELWAQESFMATLQPAFNVVCRSVTGFAEDPNRFPYSLFNKWKDETFLGLNLLLQYKYLCKESASFSESFYGLKRVPIHCPTQRLSRNHKFMSLLCLVGTPYVIGKLKSHMDSVSLRIEERRNRNIFNSIRTILSVWESLKLFYYIMYLSGYSDNHSVLEKAARVRLVYQTEPSPTWRQIFDILKHNPDKASLVIPVISKVITQSLEMGAFCIQFLNWWHGDETRTKFGSLPIPKPPVGPKKKLKSTVCPLCHRNWRVEVVLQTSGIIYCYACIKEELENTGLCPVTKIPSSVDNLVRLYLDK